MEDKIIVKNCKVEFLTTKTDNYDNDITYFKLVDKTIETKYVSVMKPDLNSPGLKQISKLIY